MYVYVYIYIYTHTKYIIISHICLRNENRLRVFDVFDIWGLGGGCDNVLLNNLIWDLLLHLHTNLLLRHKIFSCSWTPIWCYIMGSSLALAYQFDATSQDLLLHLHTNLMLRHKNFSCTCTPTWCLFYRNQNSAFLLMKHTFLVEDSGLDSRKHDTNFRSAGNYQFFIFCTHASMCYLQTRWRRLWSDRALSCFSEVVLKVQSTIPCKTQDFVHEPCSVDVKKWFKNIGGAPQNELRVVFAVAKTQFLGKKWFRKHMPDIGPTHIRSFFTSAVCSLPVSDLFVDRFHEFPKFIQ